MNDALGLVEIKGLAGAITVADAMVKTANVGLIGIEKARGFGWITIKVSGDVGAVTASVQTGRAVAEQNGQLVSFKVIPRPAPSIGELFCKVSAPEQKPPPDDSEPGEPSPPEDMTPENSRSEPLAQMEKTDLLENSEMPAVTEPAADMVLTEALPEETAIPLEEAVSEKTEFEVSARTEESEKAELTVQPVLPVEMSSVKEAAPPAEMEALPQGDSAASPVPEKHSEAPAKKGRQARSPGRPAKNKKKPADPNLQQPEEGSR
ncbi:BMC domain-containing protein [Faecalispora anaeroviscerum]|uniref:BMC domain-containing protein n=1 Tax=Faecalispora anaeroviscerum TaxID=2991836 RepID=UPI0024B8CB80|nr:BMC domain-containing protein [Faecalispora anaeroviscerum]